MGGDFSAIFPDGVVQAPYTLVMAVNTALTVLSWFENLPEEEQPPRHIWYDDEQIADWFRDVRASRKQNVKRRSSYNDAEDAPMSDNELAAEYRAKMGLPPNG